MQHNQLSVDEEGGNRQSSYNLKPLKFIKNKTESKYHNQDNTDTNKRMPRYHLHLRRIVGFHLSFLPFINNFISTYICKAYKRTLLHKKKQSNFVSFYDQ